jgi:F420-non-reducing hydrogenase iron-sulfur subunit
VIPVNNRVLRIYFFYCSNSPGGEEIVRRCGLMGGDGVKAVSLPCSGKADILYLLKAFEKGADGAVVIACRERECCNLEGNLRAGKRAKAVDSLLEEAGLGRGRIVVIQTEENGIEQASRKIGEFCEIIRKMPSSGNKG